MRGGDTDFPSAMAQFGSEGELDDSGAVVEEQALSVVEDMDQNALRVVSRC